MSCIYITDPENIVMKLIILGFNYILVYDKIYDSLQHNFCSTKEFSIIHVVSLPTNLYSSFLL